MQPFPHHYTISAAAGQDGDISLNGERLPRLASAPPAEFEGPGDRWSPETLVVAAVADSFVLTFRAIANASRFRWMALTCDAAGTLDRVERTTQFTAFSVHALLDVPAGTDEAQARRLLEKAEHGCLIANSLKAASHLDAYVEVVPADREVLDHEYAGARD